MAVVVFRMRILEYIIKYIVTDKGIIEDKRTLC